jgi:light-regulated signal transduction histidine kinase (bacteriophytochrome)
MDKEKEKQKQKSILEAQEKAILLQRQIMDNSRNVTEYYKDFESWVDEMNKKDTKILSIKSKEPQKEVIINDEAEIELKKERIKKAKELARQNKLKRDGNSIKDYYDNWDRVNEDDELIDVESKITMNNTTNEEIIKNLYNEKQKSNADKNVTLSIKSNRNRANLNSTSSKIKDEITERIEKLKKEANINFMIENYNKSIELYTYAIELIPKLNKNNVEENKKISINLYNNRGNCQIKMRNYKVGIKDFTKVLNIDENNLKGIYRRGMCYLNLDKYNLAFDDLLKAYEIANEGPEIVKLK